MSHEERRKGNDEYRKLCGVGCTVTWRLFFFFFFQTEGFTPSFYANEKNLVDKEKQACSKKREEQKKYSEDWIPLPLDDSKTLFSSLSLFEDQAFLVH